MNAVAIVAINHHVGAALMPVQRLKVQGHVLAGGCCAMTWCWFFFNAVLRKHSSILLQFVLALVSSVCVKSSDGYVVLTVNC